MLAAELERQAVVTVFREKERVIDPSGVTMSIVRNGVSPVTTAALRQTILGTQVVSPMRGSFAHVLCANPRRYLRERTMQERRANQGFLNNSDMRQIDFSIGLEFYTATGKWRCTYIGTRTIIAIRLDASDASGYAGPPYAIEESVFDEYDLGGASLNATEIGFAFAA